MPPAPAMFNVPVTLQLGNRIAVPAAVLRVVPASKLAFAAWGAVGA